jgi:outer membrane protein OmpA-like peptidoglycan-associated protein
MPNGRTCGGAASRTEFHRNPPRRNPALLAIACTALLAGCAVSQPNPSKPQAMTQVTPPPLLPLKEGVATLATAMVKNAKLSPPSASGRYSIAIDPWIEARGGDQVATTRLMQAEIEALAPQNFPQLELVSFTAASLDRNPLLLIGAIMPVARPGDTEPVKGRVGAFRVFGVLADLSTGKIASSENIWVRPDDVDLTPTAFYRDSPAWVRDDSVSAYLRTSDSRTGDAIDPVYRSNLRAEALLSEAGTAYDDGQYETALSLYRQAAELPGPEGRQLRVYNGLYLTNWALGHKQQAAAAFGQSVKYGLERGRLGVKFLFKPASIAFWPDPAISGPYPLWLQEIAQYATMDRSCLRITGHASPTGVPALNDKLSLARAEEIQQRLVRNSAALRRQTSVRGVGAREPIIANGRDDASDALDRRVEFQPLPCRQMASADRTTER